LLTRRSGFETLVCINPAHVSRMLYQKQDSASVTSRAWTDQEEQTSWFEIPRMSLECCIKNKMLQASHHTRGRIKTRRQASSQAADLAPVVLQNMHEIAANAQRAQPNAQYNCAKGLFSVASALLSQESPLDFGHHGAQLCRSLRRTAAKT